MCLVDLGQLQWLMIHWNPYRNRAVKVLQLAKQQIYRFLILLTLCMWSVSDPVSGPDSATNSPLEFTVSNLPLMQKLHLSSGFQSNGSGRGDVGAFNIFGAANAFCDESSLKFVFVMLFLLCLKSCSNF